MILTQKKIDEFEKKLIDGGTKPNTIETYKASLMRLLKKTDKSSINLEDIELVEIYFEQYSLNTRKLLFATILKFLSVMDAKRGLREEWALFYEGIKKEVVEIEKKNELKESEKEKYVEYEEMKQKFKDFVNDEEEVNTGLFLLANLLLLPAPTRLGNYRDMKFIKTDIDTYKDEIEKMDEKENYLLEVKLNTKTIYIYRFGNYKTTDSVGDIVVKIEDPLLIKIVKLAIETGKFDEIVKTRQVNQTKQLTSITKRIYGVGFSVDMIRHSFITWFYKTSPTAKQKEEVLKLFGNKYTPTTADLYYRKT
jgi:integrase